MLAKCLSSTALFVTLPWVFAAALFGQGWVPFPASEWDTYSADVLAGLKGPHIATIEPLCLPSVGLSEVTGTRRLRLGDWEFRGLSRLGTLLVFSRYGFPAGGVATGSSGITGIDVAQSTAFPSSSTVLIICCHTTSSSAVKGFVFDSASGPQSGTFFDFATGALPQPGEFFISASLLGSTLFVHEGTTGEILRFYDADADGLPDTRDASFRVGTDLPSTAVYRNRGPIDCFRNHPGFVVRTYHRFGDKQSGVLLDTAGAPYYQRQHRFGTGRSVAGYPFFPWGPPIGGQTSLYVQGLVGQQIVVETALDSNSPWTVISGSPLPATQPDQPVLASLTAPLVAGQLVRARDAGATAVSETLTIQAPRPVVLTKHKGVGSGTLFEIAGNNFSPQSTVRFRAFGAPSVDLAVTQVSSNALTIQAPATSVHLQGFCLIEAPGEPPTGFYLMVAP